MELVLSVPCDNVIMKNTYVYIYNKWYMRPVFSIIVLGENVLHALAQMIRL